MSLRYHKNDPFKDFKKALMRAVENSDEISQLYYPQREFHNITMTYKEKGRKSKRVMLKITGVYKNV